MGLGIIALIIGLGAAGAGAYVGFATNGLPVALPGSLAGASPEAIAIVMLISGAITWGVGAPIISPANQSAPRGGGPALGEAARRVDGALS